MLRRHVAVLVLAVIFGLGIGGAGYWGTTSARAAEDFGSGAERFIREMADQAISSLTVKDIPTAEREQRFREIMQRYIAFKGVARWVVGRKVWKAATEQQQAEYLDLFEDLMVATYAHRFEDYSGETLEIRRTDVYDGTDALVSTEMVRPGATKPLSVGWRVRAKDGEYRIVDIIVEGLSMARKQRSEFASFLRQNDDNIEALIAEIRGRVAGTVTASGQ